MIVESTADRVTQEFVDCSLRWYSVVRAPQIEWHKSSMIAEGTADRITQEPPCPFWLKTLGFRISPSCQTWLVRWAQSPLAVNGGGPRACAVVLRVWSPVRNP